MFLYIYSLEYDSFYTSAIDTYSISNCFYQDSKVGSCLTKLFKLINYVFFDTCKNLGMYHFYDSLFRKLIAFKTNVFCDASLI